MAHSLHSSPEDDPGLKEDIPIINELLCFIANKYNTMTPDEIVLLCSKCFDDEEIGSAKQIMRSLCTKAKVNLDKYKRRSGPNKGKKNIEDIVSMLHDLGTNVPSIVAKDLHKLPPIGFDTIDVTYFLHRMEKLETEVSLMKNAFQVFAEAKEKEISQLRGIVPQGTPPSQQEWPTISANLRRMRPPPVQSELLPNRSQGSERNTPPTAQSTQVQARQDESTEEDDRGEWRLVVKNGKSRAEQGGSRAKTVRRGTNPVVETKKLSATKKHRLNFFTSNWGTDVVKEDVINYFKNAHKLDSIVEPITTKSIRHTCFRVEILVDNIDRVYDSAFWPDKIIFRKYYIRNEGSGSGLNVNSNNNAENKVPEKLPNAHESVNPIISGNTKGVVNNDLNGTVLTDKNDETLKDDVYETSNESSDHEY